MASGKSDRPRVGLALAGGGPLGGTYEVGALIALDEAIEGVDLHELDAYVGVSAGAFISANLANRFSMAQIARIFISNESDMHPITPSIFMRPAWNEYLRGLRALPAALVRSIGDFIRQPFDTGLLGALNNLQRSVPNALWANEPLRKFLADLYSSRGHTDDFRKLEKHLFVVATELNTGRSVVFGSDDRRDTPISTAVQASTAFPGLFPPVTIDGHDHVDGGLIRTLHASVALETDIELLLCVNPLVPYDAHLAGEDDLERLADRGLPAVLAQSLRTIIHSRMAVGMERYDDLYPDKDVLLFEPRREDSRMFFSNMFSYSNRRKICEHAYQATRADILARREEIEPILARHGMALNMEALEDAARTFTCGLAVSDEARLRGRYKNATTNRLSETLDELERRLG